MIHIVCVRLNVCIYSKVPRYVFKFQIIMRKSAMQRSRGSPSIYIRAIQVLTSLLRNQDTKSHYLQPLDVVILPTLSEGGKGQFWSDWSQQSSIRLFRYKVRVCGDRSEPYIGRLLYSGPEVHSRASQKFDSDI